MHKFKLKMDLQHFADGEGEEDFSQYITDDGGLDVDSLMSDYKESDDGDLGDFEAETDTEFSEEGEGDPESHGDEGHVNENLEEEPYQEPEKRTPDAAFAEMRRRAEQNEKFANWVQELATRQGFSDPDQLIEAFNKQQLAREAQAQGVPVDVYERLNHLETENKQKEEQMFQERFNNEVEAAKNKYNLSDEQLNETFKFMAQRGFIDVDGRTSIPFEDAYTLANKDTFIAEAKESARQEYLKEQEKKQRGSAPNPKTNATDGVLDDADIDLSTEGIFAALKEMDIDYN